MPGRRIGLLLRAFCPAPLRPSVRRYRPMQSTINWQWRGLVGFSLLLFGCSRSSLPSPKDKGPIYQGKPLREWAVMTQDQDIGGGPSARDRQAAEAVRAIGATQAIPFLVRWLHQPLE